MTLDAGVPAGKDQNKYLPLMYRGLRYPRMARNMLENREQVAQRLRSHAGWNTEAALSSYRTFRPRFLNYLIETRGKDGKKRYTSERRPVGLDDLTPFVMVAYSSAHYDIPQDDSEPSNPPNDGSDSRYDLEALLAVATKAAAQYFSPLPANLEQNQRAFWVSANCMPPGEVADEHGNVRTVDAQEKESLANQDVSSNLASFLFYRLATSLTRCYSCL